MEKIKLSINPSNEKKMPSNLEAEQALIGSVLVNNDIIDEISTIINSLKFLILFIEKYTKPLKI